jgi:hypothetical protein
MDENLDVYSSCEKDETTGKKVAGGVAGGLRTLHTESFTFSTKNRKIIGRVCILHRAYEGNAPMSSDF